MCISLRFWCLLFRNPQVPSKCSWNRFNSSCTWCSRLCCWLCTIWSYCNLLEPLSWGTSVRLLSIWTQESVNMEFDIWLRCGTVFFKNPWVKQICDLRNFSWWMHDWDLVNDSKWLVVNCWNWWISNIWWLHYIVQSLFHLSFHILLKGWPWLLYLFFNLWTRSCYTHHRHYRCKPYFLLCLNLVLPHNIIELWW